MNTASVEYEIGGFNDSGDGALAGVPIHNKTATYSNFQIDRPFPVGLGPKFLFTF